MKYIITLLFVLSSLVNSQAGKWLTSYDAALKVAQAENKLILIDFWATWCKPCTKMDIEVWSDPEIQELQDKFVAVKIDIDLDPSTASKYRVRAIPAVMILDAWGNLLHEESFMSKSKTQKILSTFPQNIQQINSAYLTYLQSEKNLLSGLQLAEIYQSYALILEGLSKEVFIKMSDEYLSNCKKQCKKAKDDINMSKVEILKSINLIYRGKAKKSVSNLEELLEKEKINPIYKPMAYYAIVLGCRATEQSDKETQYMTMLQEAKGSKPFLKKLAQVADRT
jgi:thioredoxin-like negative regulator of GroEL